MTRSARLRLKALPAAVRTLCLEPGVLFPIANIFVFAQANSRLALGLAVANAVLSAFAVFRPVTNLSPLRITMWMVLLSSACSFWSGRPFPGVAGLMFGAGHFMMTNDRTRGILTDASASAAARILFHPAIYYGLGSILVGIMAGGGKNFTPTPGDPAPLIMVGFGAATIIVASLGFALNFLTAAVPFWILAAGMAINGMAGIYTGNIAGAISCLFSMLGGLRLGWITHRTRGTMETSC